MQKGIMQKRWLCSGCEREWVYVHGWSEGDPCVICNSYTITLHTYHPAFPGADIPRLTREEVFTNANAFAKESPIPVTAPPLTLVASRI